MFEAGSPLRRHENGCPTRRDFRRVRIDAAESRGNFYLFATATIHSIVVTSNLAPRFRFASSLPQQKQHVSQTAGE